MRPGAGWSITSVFRRFGVDKGILPVAPAHPPFVCYLNFMEIMICQKDEVNLTTLSFGDITKFKTVVSLCHSQV